MKPLLLNIGSGTKSLPGFVNIDIHPAADLHLDVTKGLPFGDNTVQAVFSEHFFEHINTADGTFFLRECRRVLRPGGVVRIATPDLDFVVDKYQSNWEEVDTLRDFNLDWIQTRCEYINTAMREWGHQWIYNEEELLRVGRYAGLRFHKRYFNLGESDFPYLRGLEYRKGSRLICEFLKPVRNHDTPSPKVSILIPSYRATYFRESLESALHQTYPHCEVFVSDDCPDDAIEKIVRDYSGSRFPIHYSHNSPSFGGRDNLIHLFRNAPGPLIKFLNDDDVLAPNCVQRMAGVLLRYPDVTLVTSPRQPIDQHGNPLPNHPAANRLVTSDSIFCGYSVAQTLVASKFNFVGEPTTPLFWLDDLIENVPDVVSFCNRAIRGNGDVAMWMTLLGRGDFVYLAETLSKFRIHADQAQHKEEVKPFLIKTWQDMRFDAQRYGLFRHADSGALAAFSLEGEPAGADALPPEPLPKSDQPRVSIIIPTFNRCDLTEQCLISLFDRTCSELPFEVIVVDNASTDATRTLLQARQNSGAALRTIFNAENAGFAKACNQGAEAAQAPLVLFLNNDTEVIQNWLEVLVATLESDDAIGAVGSKLIYPDGTIQHAGVMLVDDRQNGDPFLARNVGQRLPGCDFSINRPGPVEALTGACLLLRKSTFKAAGGFDEGFVNGYEDIDLCLKLRHQGKTLVYQPASVVVHHESKSGPQRFAHVAANVQRLHDKWLGKIPLRYAIDQDGTLKSIEQATTPPASGQPAGRGWAEQPLLDLPVSGYRAEKFNVVIMQPPGYQFSLSFLEIGELLCYSLNSLGHSSRLQINRFEPEATNIILGYNLLDDPQRIAGHRSVIYQLEQLSLAEGWFNERQKRILQSVHEIWDYSTDNIRFLLEQNLKSVRHVPLGYHPKLRRLTRGQQDVDVLFYGSINERRKKILEELSSRCHVKALVGVFGSERDRWISRSKIVLNLHFYEAKILEEARISYLLNNRCFVLSEESNNTIYQDGIVMAPYDKLVATCLEYLDNERGRYQVAKRGFEILKERPMETYLSKALAAANGQT